MNNYNYWNYQRIPIEKNRNNYYSFMNSNYLANQSLYNPKEGFERGNLFQNLYSSYKNYQFFPLNPNTEQEKKLQEIQTISFAMHELNLYLDLHPEDQSMMTLFEDYRKKCEELSKSYEEVYGPFTTSTGTMNEWVHSSWPWEVKNV